MTQLGRHSAGGDFRNRVAKLRIADRKRNALDYRSPVLVNNSKTKSPHVLFLILEMRSEWMRSLLPDHYLPEILAIRQNIQPTCVDS
jgi:hypothetical protein